MHDAQTFKRVELTLQTRVALSLLAPSNNSSFPENRTHMTDCTAPVSEPFNAPVWPSQTVTFLSLLPVAKIVPAWFQATLLISPLCPTKLRFARSGMTVSRATDISVHNRSTRHAIISTCTREALHVASSWPAQQTRLVQQVGIDAKTQFGLFDFVATVLCIAHALFLELQLGKQIVDLVHLLGFLVLHGQPPAETVIKARTISVETLEH
jgi:hypothetical protein